MKLKELFICINQVLPVFSGESETTVQITGGSASSLWFHNVVMVTMVF